MRRGLVGILEMIRSGILRAMAVAATAILMAACEASSINAPQPSPMATVLNIFGAPETTDEKLYRTGLKYLAEYNSKDNHKAMYCGETETHIGCSWVYYRDTPEIADQEARANCENSYGSCEQFAVNGQLSPWAAQVADQHDPAGAAARQAAFERDRRAGGGGAGLRQAIDGGIQVLSGAQGVVGAAQSAYPTGGYSQRGAFVDCTTVTGSPECASRAAGMNSAGPGAVRSTYGQGSGTPAPTSRSTITGLK
jgi:hypothetical protein